MMILLLLRYLLEAFCPARGERHPAILWIVIGSVSVCSPMLILLLRNFIQAKPGGCLEQVRRRKASCAAVLLCCCAAEMLCCRDAVWELLSGGGLSGGEACRGAIRCRLREMLYGDTVPVFPLCCRAAAVCSRAAAVLLLCCCVAVLPCCRVAVLP